ncbi:MAG: hypothetical protein ACLU48_04300 [Clostridiaceae bacterium]
MIQKEKCYLFPGMFRDYSQVQGENKTIFEYRNTEEDEQETSAGKVRIKSFGSFLMSSTMVKNRSGGQKDERTVCVSI